MSTSLVDLFLMVNFATRLALPFKKWPAYKTGVIDESGTIVTPPDKRTTEQSKSFQTFDVVVRNLKRLLEMIPGGSSPVMSTAAALLLLKEYRGEIPDHVDSYEGPLLECLKIVGRSPVLTEEMSVVGGGSVAGADGSTGPARFTGRRVFDVSPRGLLGLRNGKKPHRNYKHEDVDDEGTAEAMKTYAQTFPKAGIIARCKSTGHMVTVKHGRAMAANEQAEIDTRMDVLESALTELDDRLANLQEVSLADIASHIGSIDPGSVVQYVKHIPIATDGSTIAGVRDAYGKVVKKAKALWKRHKQGLLGKDVKRVVRRTKAAPKLAKIKAVKVVKATKAAKVQTLQRARTRIRKSKPSRPMNMG
jgi:hypothetical protein